MAGVAGALISVFIRPVSNKVASLLLDEFTKLHGLDVEIRKLSDELLWFQAVLEDAENKQANNRLVEAWLKKLRDVIYDADDVLDEVATEAGRMKAGLTGSVSSPISPCYFNLCCSWCAIPSHYKMAHRVKDIRERLRDISQKRESLGLAVTDGPCQPVEPWSTLGTSPMADATMSVVGREKETEKIIESLFAGSSDGRVTLVPITGMGGIGKTTLAQAVYNDQRVEEAKFYRQWLFVGENFNAIELIKKITGEPLIHPITKKEISNPTLSELHLCLEEKLKDKKFLIVLDDVWCENREQWRQFWNPLTHIKNGSKVIMTTRNQKVVDAITSTLSNVLDGLSKDDCWSIFKECAFPNGDSNEYQNLKQIGEMIVEKLKGHPLAARVVGSSLRDKKDTNSWIRILESKTWPLILDGTNETILPVLKLSYRHLPAHLKKCFAYCSLFPKDHIFDKERLVQMWMAQDFIQHRGGEETFEDVGNDYFDDLLQRSLFQCIDQRYVMHDLIHDLAQIVSIDECQRIEEDRSYEIIEGIRHLSIFCKDIAIERRWFGKAKKAHTLLYDTQKYSYEALTNVFGLLDHLNCIRVLHLTFSERLPSSIWDMKHLRYLHLITSIDTNIILLPESLCDLYNLQTLILGKYLKLPEVMNKLINLRHLEACEEYISTIRGIGRLTSLQELKAFRVSREIGHRLEELKGMVQLRGKLGIRNIENIRSAKEAAEIQLKRMVHLDELELLIGDDVGKQSNTRLLEEVLEALQPPPHLKSLKIQGTHQTKPPRWMQAQELISSQLVSVCLSRLDRWESLPPLLGKLCFLKRLKIQDMAGVKQVGHELFGGQENDGMFLTLEELEFSGMKSWERWAGVEEGQDNGWLPSLRSLKMTNCPMLKEMPPAPPNLRKFTIRDVGLKSLSSWLGHHELVALEVLMISECKELVSLFRDDDNVGEAAETTTTRSESVLRGGGRHLASLSRLEISDCPKLRISTEEVAAAFVNLASLSQLEIRGCQRALTSLPGEALRHLTKLEVLWIHDCEQLELLGLETLLLASSSSLRRLAIFGCPKLTAGAFQLMSDVTSTTTPSSIKLQILLTDNKELLTQLLHFPARFESLYHLHLSFPEEVSTIFGEEEEEGWWQKFPSLEILWISDSPNLRSLPAGLHHLSSLRELEVWDCPEIQCLPERGLPPSLESLSINDCPVLMKRCLRKAWVGSPCISLPPPAGSTSDWPKIARILSIEINNKQHGQKKYAE